MAWARGEEEADRIDARLVNALGRKKGRGEETGGERRILDGRLESPGEAGGDCNRGSESARFFKVAFADRP